jgi:glycosyltransferase involved in cell wall biosynthesis
MRLLMLDNEYPPLGGGTGVVNYHLLTEFSQMTDRAIEVDLVTSSRTRATYEYDEMTPAIRLHKVPVDNHNIHHSTNVELLRYTARGYRHARRLARKRPYDLVFAFAGVPAGGIALGLRATAGLPYVVSLQGPDVPGFEDRYRLVYRVLTPFIRQVWWRAAAVLAISQRHRALAWQTMPGLPIDIIYNGVDLSQFTPVDHATRAEEAPVRILCAARLIERKGQHHLLAAAQLLKARGVDHFTIVFAGTGDFEPALRQQAEQSGLAAHVEFLGFVPRTAMPDVYAQADIFCLPSFNEGMSMALLEAMASGLPVVVTETGGVDELIDGNGLVVPWANPVRLADSLAELVGSRAQRTQLGARGRTIAAGFTWPAIARQYLALFDRVLAKSGPLCA